MLDFFIAGFGYAVLFIVPLIVLPVIFDIAYCLRRKRKVRRLTADELDLDRLNFNIFRYVAYLLIIPTMVLITSVVMGYLNGFAMVLDSMPGLIAAITVAFTWAIYRLVKLVSARTEHEQRLHSSS